MFPSPRALASGRPGYPGQDTRLEQSLDRGRHRNQPATLITVNLTSSTVRDRRRQRPGGVNRQDAKTPRDRDDQEPEPKVVFAFGALFSPAFLNLGVLGVLAVQLLENSSPALCARPRMSTWVMRASRQRCAGTQVDRDGPGGGHVKLPHRAPPGVDNERRPSPLSKPRPRRGGRYCFPRWSGAGSGRASMAESPSRT
jgi:hypothetical protein